MSKITQKYKGWARKITVKSNYPNVKLSVKLPRSSTIRIKRDESRKQGDKNSHHGKSNKDDGFYLQTSTVANPLIRFDYEFEELSEVIKLALDDAFSKTNEIKFVKADGEEVTNKILVYNVDDGKFKLEDNA